MQKLNVVLYFQNSIFHSSKNQKLGNTGKSNEISSWHWGVDFIIFFNLAHIFISAIKAASWEDVSLNYPSVNELPIMLYLQYPQFVWSPTLWN